MNRVVNGSFTLPERMDSGLFLMCGPEEFVTKVYSRGWASPDRDFPFDSNLTYIMIVLPAIVLVSKTLYFLLRPLRQPRIVCDIIGGALFGPVSPITRYGDSVLPTKSILTVRTLAAFGLIFHLFLMGVKMDPGMVVQSGRKALWVGIFSAVLPFAVVTTLSYLIRDYIMSAIARGGFLFFISASVSVSAFPVLGDVLAELRILNTELGRLGMSSAMINGVFGWFFMALFTAVQQSQYGWRETVSSILSLIAMVSFIVFVLGPCMRWIVRQTPRGTQVRDGHLWGVFFCVLALGLISDVIGASPMDGPLILGLVVPDGPPLGSALVHKIELVVSEVLMPIFFFAVGNVIFIPPLSAWIAWSPLAMLVVVGYLTKIIGTIVPAFCCHIPLRNATLLALIMSFRGVVEIITLYHLRYGTLLDNEAFSIIVVLAVASTAIAAPLVSTMYKPMAANYRAGRRTVEHLKTHAELLILACVHNDGPVATMINLMEAASSVEEGPMSIYALHLTDLDGRATSTLIAHKNRKGFINPAGMDRLMNAFLNYEQEKKGAVTVMPFTAVSPYQTMHQDICSLATEKRAVLILIPYPRKDAASEATATDLAVRSMVPEILALAPCSVGILVHRTLTCPVLLSPDNFQYKVGVLFWGGPDGREALSYASRMARHVGVTLRITRFIPPIDMRESMERQLDDKLVEDFKIGHSYNKNVMFKDVLAKDTEETLSVIRNMDSDYDLIIIGRREGTNSCLSEDLGEWTESPELGIVGDMLASQDFDCSVSILIMQQHGRGDMFLDR